MTNKKSFVACRDHQSRTCIQVERTTTVVKFIPLDILVGLQVNTMTVKEFDQVYKPMIDYPIDKACKLYLSYSQNIGASKEALEYLGKVIPITSQEITMATKRQEAAVSQTKAQPAKAQPAKAQPAKAQPAKAQPAKAQPAKAQPAKADKKPSASQMFQDLIMEGKLTDDEIFAKVQSAYGLDEKKRGYVKWYRNHLKKSGANPPEPK